MITQARGTRSRIILNRSKITARPSWKEKEQKWSKVPYSVHSRLSTGTILIRYSNFNAYYIEQFAVTNYSRKTGFSTSYVRGSPKKPARRIARPTLWILSEVGRLWQQDSGKIDNAGKKRKRLPKKPTIGQSFFFGSNTGEHTAKFAKSEGLGFV